MSCVVLAKYPSGADPGFVERGDNSAPIMRVSKEEDCIDCRRGAIAAGERGTGREGEGFHLNHFHVPQLRGMGLTPLGIMEIQFLAL